MKMSPNQLMRRLIMIAGVVISLLSVAILHAYAGNDPEEIAVSPAYNGAVAASVAVQPVVYKKIAKTIYTVDVCPGDTLWDIAAAHLPEGRAYVRISTKSRRRTVLRTPTSGQAKFLSFLNESTGNTYAHVKKPFCSEEPGLSPPPGEGFFVFLHDP